jgi:sterol O-acyltransferase
VRKCQGSPGARRDRHTTREMFLHLKRVASGVLTAVDSDIGVLHVLAPVLGLLLLLWLLSVLQHTCSRGKHLPEGSGSSSSRRVSISPFLPRASHLDTHGTLLASWLSPRISPREAPPVHAAGVSSGEGWGNLVVVLTTLYAASELLHTKLTVGAFLTSTAAAVLATLSSAPLVVRDFAITTLAAALIAYMHARMIREGWWGPASLPALALQVVGQGGLFGGVLLYARTSPAVRDWPLLARLALLLEAVVLTLKLHSWITINRRLACAHEALKAAYTRWDTAGREGDGHACPSGHACPPEFLEQPVGEGDPIASTLRMRRSSTVTPSPPRPDARARGLAGLRRFAARQLSDSVLKPYLLAPTPTDEGGEVAPLEVAPTSLEHHPESPPGPLPPLSSFPYPPTVEDLLTFGLSPTLCYEPSTVYPRSRTIRLGYLLEKILVAAALTVFGLLLYASAVAPVLVQVSTAARKSGGGGVTWAEGALIADAVSRISAPMGVLVLVLFYVTFECLLNASAEISRFADRAFYSNWYASTSFAEFSRKWNMPVHEFLLRYLYLGLQGLLTSDVLAEGRGPWASILAAAGGDGRRPSLRLPPQAALLATYTVSIILHEVIVWGLLGRVTPWLAIFSLFQFPLLSLMRMPYLRGKRLGNILFWAGLILGSSTILVLYAREYPHAL